ncbi:DeoR/GlpR family DNA-binding transcription regulator [Actinotalea sp. M2MS4P-6]|uniref:DeoR/GlpR family DNA-binding transcription regulator n=1 Tax=Actinotalea sp. M2MS4P-6 TaxID=2983762 RepID=UPI0021E4612A|nr:DeoR/GlpR family DNA-binding transcription regulator [Actinotalea sp. M2MS4P-6]MCV2394948.1 DeoR/GlpR family DNA-binding transcription regulator [Actinotalea sp. M2MS4P-6]
MLTATRQAEILRLLQESGAVAVEDLADRFGVSASTIRRDLNVLSAEGLLRRVRGGSIEADAVPFADVARQAATEKERVAEAAAALVRDGDVVLVDIGTTTAGLARRLRGKRITVLTSSLAVVDELRDDDDVELVVLGGVVRKNYQSMVGMLTEQAISQLRAHVCFLGTSGVRPDGVVMDTTGIEVPVKRAMIASAERTVLLADRTKFPGTGLLDVCGANAVQTLVTNVDADPATLDTFRLAGAEVVTA